MALPRQNLASGPLRRPPQGNPSIPLKKTRNRNIALICILAFLFGVMSLSLVSVFVENYKRIARDSVQVDQQIKNLRDADTAVRYRAAEALGDLGSSRATEPLIAALKDPDAGLRSRAAEALGKILDRSAVEPLIAVLNNDKDSNVRRKAAAAVGRIGGTRAVEPLIAALRDTDSNVRRGAAEGLFDVPSLPPYLEDPRTIDPLTVALKDTDGTVRGAAARDLAKNKDPRAQSALLAAVQEHNPAAIAVAYTGVIRQGEPGAEDALIEALNEYGDVDMARTFLNCGNPKLEEAARAWALNHGFQITTGPGSGPSSQWGGKQ